MSVSACSSTPLPRKLGLKPGLRACLIDAPEGYAALLGDIVAQLQWQQAPDHDCDWVQLFVRERARLQSALRELRGSLRGDAVLWISWPKKASKQPTDIGEDAIRADALPLGLVDVKVCAVDAVWSGLKLVLRKELR